MIFTEQLSPPPRYNTKTSKSNIMKSIQLLFLSLLSFLCFSCIDLGGVSTSENQRPACYTPPEAIIGTEKLAFMKGDTVWVPGRTHDSFTSSLLAEPSLTFKYETYEDGNTLFSIVAFLYVEDSCQFIYESFGLAVVNPSLDLNSNIGLASGIEYWDTGSDRTTFVLDTTATNFVEFSNIDITTGDISGSFSFTTLNETNGDTIQIRNGIFDGNIYD